MYFKKIFIFLTALMIAITLANCSIDPAGEPHAQPGGSRLHPLGAKFDSPSKISESISVFPSKLKASQLPLSYDLSPDMPPVGDQGFESSCVGWSTTYYMKTFLETERAQGGWNPLLATGQFSPAWTYNQINGGSDNGAYPSDAMNLILYKGADTLSDFPWDQNDFTTLPDASQVANASKYVESAWQFISLDVNSIKSALASGRPVVISILVFTPDFDLIGTSYSKTGDCYSTTNLYKSFFWPDYGPITSFFRGGHAICLVGYDDNKPDGINGQGAFKFVNSWGVSYGVNGYGWISYGLVNIVIEEAVTFD